MTQKLPCKEPGRAHKRRNNTGRLTFHFVLFALLGVMLLIIAVCKPLRRSLHRTFFI